MRLNDSLLDDGEGENLAVAGAAAVPADSKGEAAVEGIADDDDDDDDDDEVVAAAVVVIVVAAADRESRRLSLGVVDSRRLSPVEGVSFGRGGDKQQKEK